MIGHKQGNNRARSPCAALSQALPAGARELRRRCQQAPVDESRIQNPNFRGGNRTIHNALSVRWSTTKLLTDNAATHKTAPPNNWLSHPLSSRRAQALARSGARSESPPPLPLPLSLIILAPPGDAEPSSSRRSARRAAWQLRLSVQTAGTRRKGAAEGVQAAPYSAVATCAGEKRAASSGGAQVTVERRIGPS